MDWLNAIDKGLIGCLGSSSKRAPRRSRWGLGSASTPGTRLWFAAIGVVLLAGCLREQSSAPAADASGTPPTPRASVALKVLVVNEPALAEAINRLRGEWAESSGGTLMAEGRPWADVAKVDNIDADIVIFPARYLGELVERRQLRPMRDSAVRGKLYDAEDVLPLVREKLANYGGRVMALPLGVVMPLVGYRREWLAGGIGSPPAAWQAYRELVAELKEVPPMWPARESVDHWPAIMMLARAASYASHPRQETVLFDPQTMAARIAEPPFVRALEEWRQEAESARQTAPEAKGESLVWAELPGADQAFNRSTGEWEPVAGGTRRVPLLAGGELLAVTASSRNAASAFDLAVWLASAEIGRQLGPIGKGALPVRRSQLRASGRWIDSPGGRAEGSQLAGVLNAALSREGALVVPRIPGADEYLAALSEAIEKALRGETSAANALVEAASRWNEITDRLGRASQRQAHRNDLGIQEP